MKASLIFTQENVLFSGSYVIVVRRNAALYVLKRQETFMVAMFLFLMIFVYSLPYMSVRSKLKAKTKLILEVLVYIQLLHNKRNVKANKLDQ